MKFISVYPADPEGYYGAGRMIFALGDYERGLGYLFQAYNMYKKSNSPYIHDTEERLASFEKELNERNQAVLYDTLAKKYNVKLK